MASTLLLDRSANDLCLDAGGNIAVATEPYSQAQDVACECKVWAGECYFDTTRGLPYADQILGQFQPVQLLKQKLAAAAELVPGVTGATIFLTAVTARAIGGQVQFKGGSASL